MNGKFQIYQDAAGEWRWRLKAANGRIVADSAEGYTRQRDAETAALRAARLAKAAAGRMGA